MPLWAWPCAAAGGPWTGLWPEGVLLLPSNRWATVSSLLCVLGPLLTPRLDSSGACAGTRVLLPPCTPATAGAALLPWGPDLTAFGARGGACAPLCVTWTGPGDVSEPPPYVPSAWTETSSCGARLYLCSHVLLLPTGSRSCRTGHRKHPGTPVCPLHGQLHLEL